MAGIVGRQEVQPGSIDAFHNEACEIGPEERRRVMSLGTILIVLLILALVGVLPTWGYSSGWGYGPGGIVGLLLVIIIILALLGRL
jgi:hypothetical protein